MGPVPTAWPTQPYGAVALSRVLTPPRWGRAGWVITGVVLALVLAAVTALLGVRA